MGLNPLKWKTKTLAYAGLSLFALYYLFIFKWDYRLRYEDTVKNTKPEHVWEYVADFSNMMKLNPTMEEFNIIHEEGNYRHWKYSVEYTERLSQIPVIRHVAQGNFSIIPKHEGFAIESKHRTCFFGLCCLDTVSEFIFLPHGNDTKCMEKVDYQCPLMFSYLCYKEVRYQRQEIMKNLKLHFYGTNKK